MPPDVFSTPVDGPFLATTGVLPFAARNSSGQITISGTYVSEVYADPNNVFCSGCLDFFFEITSNTTSTDVIARITSSYYGDYLTDVGYSTGTGSVPGGVPPATVDRSSDGGVIGFNFALPAGVGAGQATEVLEIQTNSNTYTSGSLQIIDGSVTSLTGFAPTIVPESNTAGMMLLATILFGIAFLTQRRTADR